MTQRQLIESTATDIIAAIREHGPTRDVIVPRLEKLVVQAVAKEHLKKLLTEYKRT